jgi:hypothetical protein
MVLRTVKTVRVAEGLRRGFKNAVEKAGLMPEIISTRSFQQTLTHLRVCDRLISRGFDTFYINIGGGGFWILKHLFTGKLLSFSTCSARWLWYMLSHRTLPTSMSSTTTVKTS